MILKAPKRGKLTRPVVVEGGLEPLMTHSILGSVVRATYCSSILIRYQLLV